MSERKISIIIEGMTCNKCSGRVKKALESTEGVRAADVNHNSGEAVIHFQEGKLTPEDLKKVISTAGYKPL